MVERPEDGPKSSPSGRGTDDPSSSVPPVPVDAVPPTRIPRAGIIRRLYDWVLSWAYTPYGMTALVVLCFLEASVFPIPPDPLLMALCLGAPARSFRFAAWATGASVAGGILGYTMGWGAWSLLDDFFFTWVPGVTPEAFASVQALYDRYDFWAVFLAGLTPLPYKVFTLASGVFAISFPIFVVASILSRGLRFFLVAALIWRFGPPVSRFIDRYFSLLTILFGVLLILGFAAITWLL
jgi:membrane protein YqaA with SNARE-associated domain